MIDIKMLYETPKDIQKNLVKRVKEQRKVRHISQKKLSEMTSVSYASIRRFEMTGEVSFTSFVKIVCALGFADELKNLMTRKYYASIEEIIREESRKY